MARGAQPDLAVGYQDLEAAAARLASVARRTPVETSRTLDALSRAQVFLKCENLQRAGAFKFRGAFNALAALPASDRARGVLTYSSGNHAQAIALASHLLGLKATVVMPADAPRSKRRATQGYGAAIVDYSPEATTREEVARDLAQRSGAVIVPPFDHVQVIAGQGTAAQELTADVPGLDLLLVPCGGGGLLSGSAIAVKERAPECRIVGVEPELADDATRSFRTGVLNRVHNPRTIADGARTPCLGAITFPIVRALVDDMVTVSESAIARAMRFLWERMKLVVEPTGALGLAALLGHAVPADGRRVGVILSGGNVDLEAAAVIFRDLAPDQA